MKRKNIYVILFSLKEHILSILFTLFLIGLIVFSKENIIACKKGLNLWISAIVPSLLPFFIASELLSYTDIVEFLGLKLKRIMRPIFNVPGEGSFPLLIGILCGYPVGAKIVVSLRKKKILSKIEAERLLAYTNNSSPLFIIGTVRNFSFR